MGLERNLDYCFEEQDDQRTWGLYDPGQDVPDDTTAAMLREIRKPELYWKYALELVEAWVNYQTKRKLVLNAPKIRLPLDVESLKETRDQLLMAVEAEIAKFRIICNNFSVEPVSFSWLESYLTECTAYKRAKVSIRKQQERGTTPVALAEIV